MTAGTWRQPGVLLLVKPSGHFEQSKSEVHSWPQPLEKVTVQMWNVLQPSKEKNPCREEHAKHIFFSYSQQVIVDSCSSWISSDFVKRLPLPIQPVSRLMEACSFPAPFSIFQHSSISLLLQTINTANGYSVCMCRYIKIAIKHVFLHDHPAAIPIITAWI